MNISNILPNKKFLFIQSVITVLCFVTFLATLHFVLTPAAKGIMGLDTYFFHNSPQASVTEKALAAAPQEASSSDDSGNYKIIRLKEMAAKWKGTSLEPHTVRLLSMLLQEDGTLTAERREDCKKGVCYGVGFMGHNICYRGTPLISQQFGKPAKTFCTWKGDQSPLQQFEKEYPKFSFDWEVQFTEYTIRAEQAFADGQSEEDFIRSWNWNEGKVRIQRVDSHADFVKAAIGEA